MKLLRQPPPLDPLIVTPTYSQGSVYRHRDGIFKQNLRYAPLEFTIHERFFAVLFNLLTPYPDTHLYKQFLHDGRLTKPQWWLDPDYTYGSAVFKPKNISAHELEQGRLRLYREFYSPSSMLKRLWEPRANLQDLWHAFTFLTMNLPANKEEQMRFGKALGACY